MNNVVKVAGSIYLHNWADFQRAGALRPGETSCIKVNAVQKLSCPHFPILSHPLRSGPGLSPSDTALAGPRVNTEQSVYKTPVIPTPLADGAQI